MAIVHFHMLRHDFGTLFLKTLESLHLSIYIKKTSRRSYLINTICKDLFNLFRVRFCIYVCTCERFGTNIV